MRDKKIIIFCIIPRQIHLSRKWRLQWKYLASSDPLIAIQVHHPEQKSMTDLMEGIWIFLAHSIWLMVKILYLIKCLMMMIIKSLQMIRWNMKNNVNQEIYLRRYLMMGVIMIIKSNQTRWNMRKDQPEEISDDGGASVILRSIPRQLHVLSSHLFIYSSYTNNQ